MRNRTIKNGLIDKNKSRIARILVLTGARQTGKTTLVRKSFPDYTYLSIEDPVMRENYKTLTAQQWAQTYPHAILDEVQKEPSLIESIKSVYDQYDDPKYLLLGSSQILLLEKVKESLAGRCQIIELFPLTLPEMLTNDWGNPVKDSFFTDYIMGKRGTADLPPNFTMVKDFARKKEVFEFYLKFGGYPAVVSESLTDNERYDWLLNYIRTYLERDVRDLANFRELQPFVQIQRLSALHTAQTINFTEFAKETGVTSVTAKRFINYLGISYQTILLQPWFRNPKKRLVKSPKLHYLDTGIVNAVLRKKGGMTGAEFESAIVAEIYKQAKNADLPVNFYHLRTFDGKEIDLLIETENDFTAIEIKMSSKVSNTDGRHFNNLEEILDKPLRAAFILSNDSRVEKFTEKVYSVPAGLFLM